MSGSFRSKVLNSYKEVSTLAKDSVLNISQIYTVDKDSVSEFVIKLPAGYISKIDQSIRLVLDV